VPKAFVQFSGFQVAKHDALLLLSDEPHKIATLLS